MKTTDWTYYMAHDEVRPINYHPDWPNELKELHPIMIPAGSEARFQPKEDPTPGPDVSWKDPAAKASRPEAPKIVGKPRGTTSYPQAYVED